MSQGRYECHTSQMTKIFTNTQCIISLKFKNILSAVLANCTPFSASVKMYLQGISFSANLYRSGIIFDA